MVPVPGEVVEVGKGEGIVVVGVAWVGGALGRWCWVVISWVWFFFCLGESGAVFTRGVKIAYLIS